MQKGIIIVLVLVVVIALFLVFVVFKPGETPSALDAPSAQNNVICDITGGGTVNNVQLTISGKLELEKPDKMRMEATVSGSGVSLTMVVIASGDTVYTQNPMMGEGWIKTNVAELEASDPTSPTMDEMMAMSPSELEQSGRESFEKSLAMGITPTVSCRAIGDIPDTEFQLPAGAQVQ